MTTHIGVATRTRLLNVSAVTSICGTRIYPQVLPQDCVLPAIRYAVTSSTRRELVDGASGIVQSSVQVDCYGETYLDAQNLKDKTRLALQDWAGTVGDNQIASIQLTNSMDMYESPTDADDIGVFRVMLDFELIHEEVKPSH